MGLGGQLAQRHLSTFQGLALSTESGITQTRSTIWSLLKVASARAIALAHARLAALANALAKTA
jgi:hypothetical protein